MNLEKTGKFIAKLRKEQNMTQEELAERIGVNAKTISKWETGINLPDSVLLFNLSKELKVSVQDLLNGEKIKKEKSKKSFINNINSYIFKTKKKFIILILLIIFILIFLFSTIYTFSNYNKNSIYNINFSNNLYQINGYIIFSPQKQFIIIPNFNYIGENISTSDEPIIKNFSVSLENSNGETYFSNELDLSENMQFISKVLNEYKIDYNIEKSMSLLNKNNLKDLYLVIIYMDKNDKSFKSKFKVKIDEEFTNNKLIY